MLFDRWRRNRRGTEVSKHGEASDGGTVGPDLATAPATPPVQPQFDEAAPGNGNPRKHPFWRYHRAHFSALVRPQGAKGLEIGAFDLPLIEPEEGYCDFADFNDHAFLLEVAAQKAGHAPEFVVPVTYSLREGYDHLPCDYDWIAASHVIEHIPDVLGWLRTLSTHLKSGGVLFLTVPDKRYTFDIHRSDTTFAQVVARHHAGLTQPSWEQVFDHTYHAVPVLPHDVWVGNAITPPPQAYEAAVQTAERTRHEYTDAHCSVFTPKSFRALADALIAHDLMPFRLHEILDPPSGGWDFSVSLIRT